MPPLSFVRINEIISVQYADPKDGTFPSEDTLKAQSSKKAANASPKTILFLSWADASARHIEKYTKLYNDLYPRADIILVESGMAEFFLRPNSVKKRLVEPVVKMLRDSPDDTLHVHIMSNAASKQWCTINNLYRDLEGRSPLSGAPTVLDSAPGRAHFRETWASMSGSLPAAAVPRMALSFVFGVILCALEVAQFVLPGPDMLEVSRQQLNEHPPSVEGCRRCYIYSEGDRMIGWRDVEEHANEAEKKGWRVELVKVDGSGHVGHFRQDPDRYRAAIERIWRARAKL